MATHSNQIAHMHCGGCGIVLMYVHGASSVKCAVCNFITSTSGQSGVVAPSGGDRASTSNTAVATAACSCPANTMVVIENPPTIDADGNELSNTALGVAIVPTDKSGKATA